MAKIECEKRSFGKVELRKNEESNELIIEGYAAVFNSRSHNLGWFVEEIREGAFTEVLKSKPDVRFLINHDGTPLARTKSGTLELKQDKHGLHFTATLSGDSQAAREAYGAVARGDMDQGSFAFISDRETWEYLDDPNEPDLRIIESVKELLDVSLVTYPAYEDTSIAKRSRDAIREDDAARLRLAASKLKLIDFPVTLS